MSSKLNPLFMIVSPGHPWFGAFGHLKTSDVVLDGMIKFEFESYGGFEAPFQDACFVDPDDIKIISDKEVI